MDNSDVGASPKQLKQNVQEYDFEEALKLVHEFKRQF